MPALGVTGLSVRYGKRVAVDDVSLEVAAGEVVGLLGPNGAGKSTTLLAAAGALAPDAGGVVIGDIDMGVDPLAARARVGLADQPPTLYEFLTVREHLELVAEARAGEAGIGHVTTWIESLALGPVADRLCRELSFGYRQRVGLAASLVGGTRVVLLDETLNGLDPRATRQAREALARAAGDGVAIVMSTHLLGVAEHICSRLVIMDQGKLVEDLSGDGLRDLVARGPGALETLYLDRVKHDEPAR